MNNLNSLGKMVVSMNPAEIKLDQNVKKILAYKPLLARILKEVVEECRELSYEEIEKAIEGEVIIDEVFLENGLSNAPELIVGQNVEDYQNEEGLVRYDIRTFLKLSGKDAKRFLKILLDVEAQNEDKPGYDISLRALFYCCRMISSQLGVEFSVDRDDPVKYGNLKKVYSIWICAKAADKRAGSIEQYHIARTFIHGQNEDIPRYDILNAVIINIGKKTETKRSESNLVEILTILLDSTFDAREKIGRLKKEGLPLTKEIETEVNDMCTYARGILNDGLNQGLSQGLSQGLDKGLRALVNSLKLYIKDFDAIYEVIRKNEDYADVTEEEVRKYF